MLTKDERRRLAVIKLPGLLRRQERREESTAACPPRNVNLKARWHVRKSRAG